MRSYRKIMLVVFGLMVMVLAGFFGGSAYAESSSSEADGVGDGSNISSDKKCKYISFSVGDQKGYSNSLCVEDKGDDGVWLSSEGQLMPIDVGNGKKLFVGLVGQNTEENIIKGADSSAIPSSDQIGAMDVKEEISAGGIMLAVRYTDDQDWTYVKGYYQPWDTDIKLEELVKFVDENYLGRLGEVMQENGVDITDVSTDESEPGSREDDEQTNYEDDDGVCYENSGKLGWIICPIISGAANIGNWLWGEIETNFLQIRVGEFFRPDGVESAWRIFRDIANVIFIILFMFVIFSQLTGVGIDNYGIKKIMPKLIVVAILINLSYLICVLAVDLSNILGVGLNGLFSELAKNVGTSAQVEVGGVTAGQSLAVFALTGMTTGGLALFAILNPVAALTAAASVGLAVLGIVITIVTSIFFLFLILIIRSAGIVILIAIAPIAIVCYMLPNTERLFKRWLDLLKALLLVYPICGAVVGAGRLAGMILASTNIEAMAVAGMIVEVLPFFLIPMLLKQSLALVGNIGAKLSNVGKVAGKGLSSKSQGAIRGTQRFKDWSKYNQDKALATRSGRIQRRLQRIKDNGGTLSDRNKERLLQATEAMDAYERRRILADEGKMPLDGDTLRQNIRAEKSNTLEKMYSDNYMRMTDRGQIDTAFQAALTGDSGENAAAAMNALIQKGGTTEVLNALNKADWSKMNVGTKSYLTQTMAASNVDALRAYSKYSQSGGQASFNEWSTGKGATIAAEASNDNIKAKTYAQYLSEGGENAMVNYNKDEMQFVQANADNIRAGMEQQAVDAGKDASVGASEFGAMLKTNAIKSNDAKAQTVAEDTMASQLANGTLDVNNFRITTEDIGNMRGRTAEMMRDGMAQRFIANAPSGMNIEVARMHGTNALRLGLDNQITAAKDDPITASRIKTGTRAVFIDPIAPPTP